MCVWSVVCVCVCVASFASLGLSLLPFPSYGPVDAAKCTPSLFSPTHRKKRVEVIIHTTYITQQQKQQQANVQQKKRRQLGREERQEERESPQQSINIDREEMENREAERKRERRRKKKNKFIIYSILIQYTSLHVSINYDKLIFCMSLSLFFLLSFSSFLFPCLKIISFF